MRFAHTVTSCRPAWQTRLWTWSRKLSSQSLTSGAHPASSMHSTSRLTGDMRVVLLPLVTLQHLCCLRRRPRAQCHRTLRKRRAKHADPRFPVGKARLEAVGVILCACLMTLSSFEVGVPGCMRHSVLRFLQFSSPDADQMLRYDAVCLQRSFAPLPKACGMASWEVHPLPPLFRTSIWRRVWTLPC